MGIVGIPLKTLINTAYRRVVPLYSFDDRGRPFLLASSVPFEVDGLRFLITAAHACFRNRRTVPLFVYGEKEPHTLTDLRGAWEYIPGKSPDLDVAVIRLTRECADDLQERHWFSTPSDVRAAGPKAPGVHYLIAGYPSSRNKKKPVQYGLPGRATALVTGDICNVNGVISMDKSDDFHFGIAFPHKKIKDFGGKEFNVPQPYGMSGGGVWCIEIDPMKRLANSGYLVGIGVEYHKISKTFVATRVQAVEPLARELNEPNKRRETA